MGEFSFFHILILLLLFVPILFGRRIVPGGSGIRGLPSTASVSSPSNAAMFPVSASQRTREDPTVGGLAELLGAEDLLSKRFIGAFVILLLPLNAGVFTQMIQAPSNPFQQDLILRLIFFHSVFLIVAALVLRQERSVVGSALVAALIYGVIAYVGSQLLFPYHGTSYEHFETRRIIASCVWPFLWITVLSWSLLLLRPWWLALISGLWVYDALEYFVIGAIYGVGTPYWSALPASEKDWTRFGVAMAGSLISAVTTTILFAVLLRFTRSGGLKKSAARPAASRCASAYPD
jgi:hypothetical protein